jgi:uncharacterized membrane protein
MQYIGSVLAAAVVFVGTHFLLSHPLRRPVVASIGERGFSAVYSLVALGAFVWLVLAFRAAPSAPFLWPVGNGLWDAVTLLMLIASLLFMGSLVRNPALPSGSAQPSLPDEARGVYAITRHPMMWAFALWGICHIAIFPVPKNIVLSAAIIVLALVGAALQDVKKRQLQPTLWPLWEAKTSYWPFAAIANGKARLGSFGGFSLVGAVVLWLVATWAHIPLSGWAAGIWRWIK